MRKSVVIGYPMTVFNTEKAAFDAGKITMKSFRVLPDGTGFKVLIIPDRGLPYYL